MPPVMSRPEPPESARNPAADELKKDLEDLLADVDVKFIEGHCGACEQEFNTQDQDCELCGSVTQCSVRGCFLKFDITCTNCIL